MTLYVDEFLYRGKPPGSADLPAWHVVLGDAVTNGFGEPSISLSGPMTPERAEALGFPLAAIVAQINAGMAAAADALRVEIADCKTTITTLETEAKTLRGEKSAAEAALGSAEAKLGVALATLADLRNRASAASAEDAAASAAE